MTDARSVQERQVTVSKEPVIITDWRYIGDGLVWRDRDGVHVQVLTRPIELGVDDALRAYAEIANVHGPSLAAVNRAIRGLGIRGIPSGLARHGVGPVRMYGRRPKP